MISSRRLDTEERKIVRRLPVGAEAQTPGGVHFRVWAPHSSRVRVRVGKSGESEAGGKVFDLVPEEGGYHSGQVEEASHGMQYQYLLGDKSFPDPASRYQPSGPHGVSQIVDPSLFQWTDSEWKGVTADGQVVYEMHVGTFTREGTWSAAREELPRLADLGITMIEVMPIADFVGKFGWGYDGVNLFAPTRLYGDPDELRSFVDEAHAVGLAVILDVVYNHFGPDGNYLREFTPDYFSDRYENEWGEPINFDGPNSGPVRELFTANAAYWIREFHMDGLRLDATQQIFDRSENPIIREIADAVREAAPQRRTYLVAENEPQHARLVRTREQGGYGLDAVWNDDFHHTAMVALTGQREAYYTDYRGSPQEFVSAAKHGFLYQGQYYSWQKKRRGTPTRDVALSKFVAFLQNHDQVANSLQGRRLHQISSPGRAKALTALLLLGPWTPMLFQGQEFACSAPFLYFADHNPELARRVAEGRRKFLSQFRSLAAPETDAFIANPADPRTFSACKIGPEERGKNGRTYRLHQDLLRLRRQDPVFRNVSLSSLDGAVLGPEAFLLRYCGPGRHERLLLVNLGPALPLESTPEPLLAPPEGQAWKLCWSSEDPEYDGGGTPPLNSYEDWTIPGQAALVFEQQPDPDPGANHGHLNSTA